MQYLSSAKESAFYAEMKARQLQVYHSITPGDIFGSFTPLQERNWEKPHVEGRKTKIAIHETQNDASRLKIFNIKGTAS